jgi:Integrase zinc binding domain
LKQTKYAPLKRNSTARMVPGSKGTTASRTGMVWCRVFGENDLRVIVPTELREKVLQKVHGSKARGHWGVMRTAAMVRTKYYWKGWAADVESAVAKCMACEMEWLKKPGRQGRMMKYRPSRRFELVAVDILEMTPETR